MADSFDTIWGNRPLIKGEVRDAEDGDVQVIRCAKCNHMLAKVIFYDNGQWDDCIIRCMNCDSNGKVTLARIRTAPEDPIPK